MSEPPLRQERNGACAGARKERKAKRKRSTVCRQQIRVSAKHIRHKGVKSRQEPLRVSKGIVIITDSREVRTESQRSQNQREMRVRIWHAMVT